MAKNSTLSLVLLIALLFVNHSYAGKVSSIDIVRDTVACTLNNTCAKWEVTGLCFWLDCDPFCAVNTTLKVDHYLPDFVVSVYKGHRHNAWQEPEITGYDAAAYKAGQWQTQSLLQADLGQGNQSAATPSEQDTHFKEVDVIGNPALLFFQNLPRLFLPSQARPWMLYYLSLADAYQWRSPLVEIALHPVNSLTPGRRVVGSFLNNWGSIFPRTGFLNQPSDQKAAAVIAQRAVDIVAAQHTASAPHIARALSSSSCGEACAVEDMQENSAQHALWQMVYPFSEKSCGVFGDNDLPGRPWEQNAYRQGEGNYVWILWRHYHGCIPGDGEYLFST
jgi:integrating conjugative element protein (TIGR03756 family)